MKNMETNASIIWTILLFVLIVLAVVTMVAIAFNSKIRNKAGPDWLWRGGRNDAFRRLCFREDGALRKFTVIVAFLAFFAAIGMLWYARK